MGSSGWAAAGWLGFWGGVGCWDSQAKPVGPPGVSFLAAMDVLAHMHLWGSYPAASPGVVSSCRGHWGSEGCFPMKLQWDGGDGELERQEQMLTLWKA